MNKQLHILILEDDNSDAELIEHELRKANINFVSKCVKTKKAFQENLEEFVPDLILADYTLPAFDGCSALRIVKEKFPDIPFIFVSGTIGEDIAIESLKNGATDYVLKDRITRLAPAVHRALREVEEKIEYRKAEKALKESELRFRSVVQSANDAIVLMDGKGSIVSWNTGAQAIFGYIEEEVLGKSIMDIMPERIRKDHMEKIEYANLVGKPGINGKRVESYGLKKGGIEFPVDISMATWTTEEGKFYSAIISDITERKQMEDKLRCTEEHFRSLIENALDTITVLNIHGIISYESPSVERVLGYKPEELIGKNVFELIHPEDLPRVMKVFDSGIQNPGFTYSAEYRFKHKDGSWRFIESLGKIISDNADLTDIIVNSRDITERKQADEARKISEKKYSTLVEKGNDGIIIIKDGLLEFINSKMAEIASYAIDEVIGKPFSNFVSGEFKDLVIKNYKKRLSGEEFPNRYEIEIISKDGKNIPVEINASVIEYEGKRAEMAIISDITDRKLAQKQIEASLKEKETLLKELHHRVKNNLQIISSLLGLQSEYIKEEKYLEMFRDSRNRINSMSLIHENLYKSKDFGKIEFDEYIRDLINRLFQSHGVKTGTIVTDINIQNVPIGIDNAIPCGLIINELVTNSLKYAFPDGRKGEIKISLNLNDENMVELIVGDNGVGIPHDMDFRKTESLGLHLITLLAEDQLHGKIYLDRSRGTEFKIIFKEGK